MFSLLLRALLHPFDYIGVFNKRILILTETISEGNDIYSFIFKPKKPFLWNAGQHGVFSIPHKKITGKTWRAFSIASAPEEGAVRIATIIKSEPSDFKKILLGLKVGDAVTLNGPFGEMYLKPTMKHIVGVAGGIGITPFRALIKAIASGTTDTKLTLIYSAVGGHTFKNEFDTALAHPNTEIIYTATPEEVNTELDSLVLEYQNRASYLISGAPGMIMALRKSLTEKGIRTIVNDSFKGY